MPLGHEFRDLLDELILGDDGFGSTTAWRHVARTENPATGEVAEAITTQAGVRVAFTQPCALRLFGDDTLARAQTAAIVPAAAVVPTPALLDRVVFGGGRELVVIAIEEFPRARRRWPRGPDRLRRGAGECVMRSNASAARRYSNFLRQKVAAMAERAVMDWFRLFAGDPRVAIVPQGERAARRCGGGSPRFWNNRSPSGDARTGALEVLG